MSKTSKEYWMDEARKFESWFYRANYMRTQQEVDNVALRKLVRDIWHLFVEYGTIDSCNRPEVDAVHERMRDLGVWE